MDNEYQGKGFKYSPQTGVVYRRSSRSRWSGPITAKDANGYVTLTYRGKSLKAHRLAFYIMGIDPVGLDVDHINGVTHDNRWSNIRLVSRRINSQNRASHRNGALPGVQRVSKRFKSSASFLGKRYSLGYFDTPEEAHKFYLDTVGAFEKHGRVPDRKRGDPKGYCWNKTSRMYQARITVRGRRYSLGYFLEEKEAALAYQRAREVLRICPNATITQILDSR